MENTACSPHIGRFSRGQARQALLGGCRVAEKPTSPHACGLGIRQKKMRWAKKTTRATLGVALDQQTGWSVHTGPSSWNSDYLGFSRPGIQNSICGYSLGRSQGPIVSHIFGSITQPGHGSPTIDRRCTYIHTYIRTAIRYS